ncbi:MAG: filamentous hemagglutinin N-terminal domain-containing protein, partial [Pseudanabaenaceae cyanobacterium]
MGNAGVDTATNTGADTGADTGVDIGVDTVKQTLKQTFLSQDLTGNRNQGLEVVRDGHPQSSPQPDGIWERLATAAGVLAAIGLWGAPATAQMVPDGTTPTQVLEHRILPTDAAALRGNNLYHSFSQFHVPPTGVVLEAGPVNGAIANNVLVRVTGPEASRILGTIDSRTAFPNANFFLLNPNGILFGPGARLEVGGSFHASTANGLRFSTGDVFAAAVDGVFPTGNPAALQFAPGTVPGAIVNEAALEVAAGRHLTLTGGTVLSSGSLQAPQGTVGVVTVTGNSEVVLRSPNAVLSLRLNGNAID